ncbi:MAG: hypothetical protein ACK5AO_05135 [bacterium]
MLILTLTSNSLLFSQVKIGDNPRSINADAVLEIESSNKGVLLPRIALKSISIAAPLKNFIQGMIVYNTTTNTELTPGLYYCDGTKWIKAFNNQKEPETNSNQNQLWSLKGNNGVTSNNFLGPTNDAPLIIKTNNLERMRISEKGWVGIGTSAPKSALQIKGQLIIDTLSAGNPQTDKILVANPIDGRVKSISVSALTNGVQNYTEVVSYNGQNIFNTPAIITDANKILLYRNGVLISFTVNNNNSIVSELPCKQGDQIRIIQLL